jgi:hypothetical protein
MFRELFGKKDEPILLSHYSRPSEPDRACKRQISPDSLPPHCKGRGVRCAAIVHRASGGKHILPAPFLWRIGMFAGQGLGEIDRTETVTKIFLVHIPDGTQMTP